MPDQLQSVVQRMIDAGESEDNIATVIKHFQQQAIMPPNAGDMLSRRRVTSDAPEEAPGLVQRVGEGLAPLAVPQSLGEMSAYFLPQGVSGAIGAAKAYGTAAKEALGTAPRLRDVPKQMFGVLRQRVADAETGVARGADMYQMRRAPISVERAPTAAQTIGEAAPVSQAEGIKTGIDQAVAEGRLRRAADVPAVTQQRPQPGSVPSVPEPVPASTPPAISPMQQPRIATGAEQVGREMGLSKDAVRQQTGPILGEAAGDASPILPKEPLGRIVDALKALPPGAEREAYVARATSGKAQWQIENIRRTLEHLGLLVPVAVGIEPAIKSRLESLMRSGSQ